MPVAEKTGGGTVYLRGIDQRVSTGDRVDVNEAFAAYLCEERGDFERVDSGEADEEGGDEAEVTAWEDWNEDDWLDLDYRERAEDVREGRVDEHLDAIADVETSDTVVEAVEDRRAELEEG